MRVLIVFLLFIAILAMDSQEPEPTLSYLYISLSGGVNMIWGDEQYDSLTTAEFYELTGIELEIYQEKYTKK